MIEGINEELNVMSEEMKMSDYFQLPIPNGSVKAIDYSCTIEFNNDGVSPFNAAVIAINNHDRLTSDLSATQELLRLKELECEQLAEDKAELVGHLRDVTMIASHCHAVGVRLQPFQRAEIDDAKQLLERLG